MLGVGLLTPRPLILTWIHHSIGIQVFTCVVTSPNSTIIFAPLASLTGGEILIFAQHMWIIIGSRVRVFHILQMAALIFIKPLLIHDFFNGFKLYLQHVWLFIIVTSVRFHWLYQFVGIHLKIVAHFAAAAYKTFRATLYWLVCGMSFLQGKIGRYKLRV